MDMDSVAQQPPNGGTPPSPDSVPAQPVAAAPEAATPNVAPDAAPGAAPSVAQGVNPVQPAPGYAPQAAAVPQAAYAPQPGYAPQAAYAPQPGYAPGYGQQQYVGQGYPGQPYGAPPSAPPKKKLPVWLFIVIGVVVLALIGGGIFWATSRGGGGGTTPTPTEITPTVQPDEVVQEFMQDLADGNSAAAIALMQTPPTDPTFMTDAVLAKSAELAPITNITATRADVSSDWVAVSYNLGDQPASTSFQTVQSGDGYVIANATLKVDVTDIYKFAHTATLNGVPLDGTMVSSVELFPGVYQVDLGSDYLALSTDQFTVSGPTSDSSWTADYVLADGAQAKIAAAVHAKLKACLAAKSLTTDCGFYATAPKGVTINKSTIKWAISSGKNDFSGAKFELGYPPTTVSASIKVSVKMTCKSTGGRSYYNNPIPIKGVDVDFSDPDNIDVEFSY